jgi:hypothetical protein
MCKFPQPGVPPVFWGGVDFEFDVRKRLFTCIYIEPYSWLPVFSVTAVARRSTLKAFNTRWDPQSSKHIKYLTLLPALTIV